MLFVRIGQEGTNWVDHNGLDIACLEFSKKHQAAYKPGCYPLESLGSLYRNIDDFRQSPFESRAEWEIKIPSVYSYGSFMTVDLLYELECANEQNGREFSLVGSIAVLYDDYERKNIFRGKIESIGNNGGTTSLRVSDLLGNPKIPRSEFPVSIGKTEAGQKWLADVSIDKNKLIMFLKFSDVPLEGPPRLFLKFESGAFAEIAEIIFTAKLELSGGDAYLGRAEIEYSDGWQSGIIKIAPRESGVAGYLIQDAWENYQEIILPEYMKDVLRVDKNSEKPDRYVVGEGPDSEILEAWSSMSFSGNYWIGRAEYPDGRRSHSKGEAIKKIKDCVVKGVVAVTSFAETIVGYNEAYGYWHTKGNPSQLALNSGRPVLDDDGKVPVLTTTNKNHLESLARRIDFSFDYCPYFHWLRTMSLPGDGFFHGDYGCQFLLAMSDTGLPSDTIVSGYLTLYLALKYESSYGYCKVYFNPISQNLPTLLGDFKMNSEDIQVFNLTTGTRTFTIGDLSKAVITLVADDNESCNATIGYARLAYKVQSPLEGKKIYVSGEFERSSESDSENMTVGNAARSLLKIAGRDIEVDGSSHELLYGYLLYREAANIRDKLRSLAAESATFIGFNPKTGAMVLKDMSLQNKPVPILIPLSAFVLENHFYSFKMESPESGELLSGLEIRWGKDIETGEYKYAFSVSSLSGIELKGWKGFKSPLLISKFRWQLVFERMRSNAERGVGVDKSIDSEWIASWAGAENMAYNLLRWNTKPLRKAQAVCICSELDGIGDIGIGTFVCFDLPGYPEKFSKTAWMVTGRHDNMDTMASTLELLEASDVFFSTGDVPATPPRAHLLLESGGNMLFENGEKIKLEELYG